MSARRIIDNQYEILRQIKGGGFGTIYYGWDLTLDRPVAIKEIVQELLGDKQYVDMFIDEAVNTARLNHPNIVQIYSLRKTSDNKVFIIMQYIEGVDLRDVIDRYNEMGQEVPRKLIVHIIGEVCKALEYAHNLKDRRTDQPLNIVHRDVSPSNVMLTVEGSVKLIDFGIAKARHRVAQKTQTGFVKGKVAYLSPEQLAGKEASRQSDIFSLGIVFYELLTGKELFVGDSDFTIMKKISSGDFNLSALDKMKLPDDFHHILRKALDPDLSRRYASANEMYADLYTLSRKHYPGEPISELSKLVHAMYVREEEPERVSTEDQGEQIKTQILNTPMAPPPEEETKAPPEPAARPVTEPKHTEKEAKKPKKPEKPSEPEEKPEPSHEEEAKTVIHQSPSEEEPKTTIHDKGSDEAKTSILGAYSDEESSEGKTVVRQSPFADSKKKAGAGFAEISAKLKKVEPRVWVYAGGGIVILLFLFIIASLISGDPKNGPSGEYRVWINSVPEGAKVTINGEDYGKTPLQITEMDDGQYSMLLEMDDADPVDTTFTLASGDQITFPNFMMRKQAYIQSVPQDAMIFIDGKETGKTTPALVALPIGDSVDIRLEHANAINPITLKNFHVATGKFNEENNSFWSYNYNEENDLPGITGRFLKEVTISSKPQGAKVYINDKKEPAGRTPEKVMIPFGVSQIRLVKAGFLDKERTVEITENFEGSLFYEMFREVSIKAVARDNQNGDDINANIYRIESEGRVSQINEQTPLDLQMTGVEHRVFFRKDGYVDTSFVVGVTQNELKAVMRKESDREEEKQQEEERQPDRDLSELAILIFVVVDDKNNDPLEGVDIMAEEKSDRERIHLGKTNEYGRHSVYIRPGKWMFIASKDGYKRWDDGKSIKKQKEYKFEIELERD